MDQATWEPAAEFKHFTILIDELKRRLSTEKAEKQKEAGTQQT